MWQGSRYVVGGQALAWMGTCDGVGACGRVWGHIAGCGVMWQGVGACGRVWGHVAGVMYVVGGQAYGMDGDMWQGVGTCGRAWRHVAGCGGMWQG